MAPAWAVLSMIGLGVVSDNPLNAPRQEHQVGRFLSIFEERLARRAHLRTHGQPTRQIRDLDRAHGYGKVRWDFSRADPVPETAFHERHGAHDRVLQEFSNLSVVHKRRHAHEKTAWGRTFLGRTFYGLPQKAGERVAKTPAARGALWLRERPSFLHTP